MESVLIAERDVINTCFFILEVVEELARIVRSACYHNSRVTVVDTFCLDGCACYCRRCDIRIRIIHIAAFVSSFLR